MPLRVYTGPQATVFNGIGPVTPGVPFDVPAHLLPGLDRRPDITVPEPPGAAEASEDSSRDQEADTSGAGLSGKRGRSGSPSGKKPASETGVPKVTSLGR